MSEKRFVDKYYAAAMVYCLEQHLGRISKFLDFVRVPTEMSDGEKLTVEQRVKFLYAYSKTPQSLMRADRSSLAFECAPLLPGWDLEIEDAEEINEKVTDWFYDEIDSPTTDQVN